MKSLSILLVAAFTAAAKAPAFSLGLTESRGVISLQINGTAAKTYTVAFSQTLTNWSDLVTIPITGTAYSLTDWAPRDVTRRFYRLRQEAVGAAEAEYRAFGQPRRVTVQGYTNDLMEPFMTRDGRHLLFNNRNDPGELTDLHVAERLNDVTFVYVGKLRVNSTTSLDGVATVDKNGALYFISTRSYGTTLSTVYTAAFSNGSAAGEALVNNISKMTPGWLHFDVEVSADGQTLYLSEGLFSGNPFPDTADFVLARKGATAFSRSPDSSLVFTNVNTSALEYAACISADGLEFFFTRLNMSVPTIGIYRAARSRTDRPFESPQRVSGISGGFIEAPTLSPDGRILYYHRLENNVYFLECVTRFGTGP